VQAEIPNHRKPRRWGAGVVSVAAKVPPRAGQVGDEKTNMCEPLLTHRNIHMVASKLGCEGCLKDKGSPWRRALEPGSGRVWPCAARCKRWRELVAGAGMEQENLSPR